MKYGYQLFSALNLCLSREGLIDTIEKIAKMGYDGVEFFSYSGIEAKELKEIMAENGVEGFNSHVQLERWEKDPEGEVRYAAEAGIPCVTIPWMPPEMRCEAGYDSVKELAVRVQEYADKYGVTLVYHNHDFEFAKGKDGGYVLDEILASDPKMMLELDTFWAHYAGVDPVACMEERRGRMKLIHIKDYESFKGGPIAGGAEMPTFCAIGTGKMDNAPIVKWAEDNGIEWVCVEQDNSKIPELEAAKISISTLKK